MQQLLDYSMLKYTMLYNCIHYSNTTIAAVQSCYTKDKSGGRAGRFPPWISLQKSYSFFVYIAYRMICVLLVSRSPSLCLQSYITNITQSSSSPEVVHGTICVQRLVNGYVCYTDVKHTICIDTICTSTNPDMVSIVSLLFWDILCMGTTQPTSTPTPKTY